MKNHFFSICLLSAAISIGVTAQAQVKPVIADNFQPAYSAKITGYTGNKFDASYTNRILAQDVDKLIYPFTERNEHDCWQSEFWGKWLTSAVLAYKYKPTTQLAKRLKKAVDGLIATQTPDGYIGNYAPDSHLKAWDIWGRKYCMLGLLAYYDLMNDKKALDAAVKEADCLMQELKEQHVEIVKMGNHRGMAASSVLEPICQLYLRTGMKKYLDFAEEIVRQWETPNGPQLISKAVIPVGKRFPKPQANNWYGWEQGQKAYEMMSCYEGLIELYRLTGKETYRKAAEDSWQSIMDSEINIAGSGSAMEVWFSGKAKQFMPIEHYQETCVTVTWLKFNQQLLRLTGDAKYADAIEQTFYNALLGSMRPDGSDWAKYTPLSGQRLKGSEQCNMGLNCCNANGPRGLFTIPQTAVMENREGVVVNFYISGDYTLKSFPDKSITVKMQTDFPVSGKVEMLLETEEPETMNLALRIPAWSKATIVSLNGQPVDNISSGDYLSINRNWKTGDKILIEFDMQPQLHIINNKPNYIAITRGPIVLTRDERLNGPNLEAVITPVRNDSGSIDLTPKKSTNPDIRMIFSAKFMPESYAEYDAQPIEVEFCDYASAGNTMTTFPFFRVWMPQLLDPRD